MAKRHGLANTAAYGTWKAMLKRCYCSTCRSFKNYGARGITVCERWRESFMNFYEDMGDRPPGMTLDRIDSDGDYRKENCRWASSREQSLNKKRVRMLSFNGETMCITDWAKRIGIVESAMRLRIRRYGVTKALSTPKGLLR